MLALWEKLSYKFPFEMKISFFASGWELQTNSVWVLSYKKVIKRSENFMMLTFLTFQMTWCWLRPDYYIVHIRIKVLWALSRESFWSSAWIFFWILKISMFIRAWKSFTHKNSLQNDQNTTNWDGKVASKWIVWLSTFTKFKAFIVQLKNGNKVMENSLFVDRQLCWTLNVW